MGMLIDSGEGSRFEAVEVVNIGYKLVEQKLHPSNEEIISGTDEKIIGWGMVPYYVHLHSMNSDLNKLRGELGGRAGRDNYDAYFSEYFELCRNRILTVDDPLLNASPPDVEDFIHSHIAYEVQQCNYCIQYLKDEYQEGFTSFFNLYMQYLKGKATTHISKSRVIAFYLIETGQDAHALSRKDFERLFNMLPLNLFFKDSSAENIQKEIRKEECFRKGSSKYEEAKTQYHEDFKFAKLLID